MPRFPRFPSGPVIKSILLIYVLTKTIKYHHVIPMAPGSPLGLKELKKLS